MKIVNLLFLFVLILCTALFSDLSAQKARTIDAVATKSEIKPLDAKILKLNAGATRILSRWMSAKHMELLDTGHFVPMQNPASGNTGGLPGGGMPNSYASGTNCAKIECPDVFDKSVTCWECH